MASQLGAVLPTDPPSQGFSLVPSASCRPGRTCLSPWRRNLGKVAGEWSQQQGRMLERVSGCALHPSCCIPPTSLLHLSLLLHPSYISSTAFLPHRILPASLPLSQAEPTRGNFCASRKGPGGASVPGCWVWRGGVNLHPLQQQVLGSRSSTEGWEHVQGRVYSRLWQHLRDCCLV